MALEIAERSRPKGSRSLRETTAALLVPDDLIICTSNDLDELEDCDLRAVSDPEVLVIEKPVFVEAEDPIAGLP